MSSDARAAIAEMAAVAERIRPVVASLEAKLGFDPLTTERDFSEGRDEERDQLHCIARTMKQALAYLEDPEAS